MSERNPYSPPGAVVEDEHPTVGEDVLIPNGESRPLDHGWKWISSGWSLFKAQPGMWILNIVIAYAAIFLLSMIPLVNFVMSIVWPIIGAGYFAMADAARRGEHFGVGHLLAGFQKRAGPLALVGAIYLAVVLVSVAIFAIFGGSVWFAIASGTVKPEMLTGLGLMMLLYVLVVSSIGMLIAFAPALVFFHDVPPVAAMKMSVAGCLKNMMSGTVYAILLGLIVLLSAIPLGLGLLVTIPLMTASFYSAYRDIFVKS